MRSNFIKSQSRKEIHFADWLFASVLRVISIGLILLLVIMGLFLLHIALPSIQEFGLSFLYRSTWDPVHEIYGAFPVIYGTVVSSGIALLLSAPLSIGVALFLCELAPPTIARFLGFLVEMLAAVPSVIYGLWGVFVLAPWLKTSVEPFLEKYLGFLPLFSGPFYGIGMLAAGVILAIMISPTIFTISREIFSAIPTAQREAALALGATRWEMIRIAVLKSSQSGVMGGVILGLGRALGETMAVTMVIGNRPDVSFSLFAPGQTMASAIANEYAEASSDLHLAAIVEIGLTLFAVSAMMNMLARLIIHRTTDHSG